MKKWVWIGFAGVVLLWLLGAGMLLPAIQKTLETAAKAELAKPEYTNAFDDVQVSFSGQEATLTGRVSSQRERDLAGTVVSEKVRVADSLGSSLNPVTAVVNHVVLDYALAHQRPKPWLLVAAYGKQATVAGVLPVEWKEPAAKALTAKLAGSTISNLINSKLAGDAKPRPAADANATLDAKTLPQVADGEIAVSVVDGHWVTLKPGSQDAEISSALLLADVDYSDLTDALSPLRTWQAAEKEKARQATLPPAYAGVTVLPDTLHVWGLVGDDGSQRRLMVALTAAFPKRKVLTNALKLSGDVRSESDWVPAVAELPKKDGEAFIAALKSGAKPVIWDGKGDQAAMQKALEGSLSKTFGFTDLWEPYANWQKAKNAPPPPPAAPPAAAAPAATATPPANPAASPPALKIPPPTLITPTNPPPVLAPAAKPAASPSQPGTLIPAPGAPAVPVPAPAPAPVPTPAKP